ncbi:MAG: SIMPL domain-containing protein [Gemmatimonadaceae bacterium]
MATAIAQAKRQAAALAAALGGSLGELLLATTNAQSDEGVRPFGYALAEAPMRRLMPGTSITPKEIIVEATVVARWRFIGR